MFRESWHSSWDVFMDEENIGILDAIGEALGTQDYYPEKADVLRFMDLDASKIRYIIVGMEPYPSFSIPDGCPQATGRSFEVSELRGKGWDYKIRQSSLRNILKAIYYDSTGTKESMEGIRAKIADGDFAVCRPTEWFDRMEEQGVMFLNSTLTVAAGKVGSHKAVWAPFRGKLISFLDREGVVWMLWGNDANSEIGPYIRNGRILSAPHPRVDAFVMNDTFRFAGDVDWTGMGRPASGQR